jgi:hypothetical protein
MTTENDTFLPIEKLYPFDQEFWKSVVEDPNWDPEHRWLYNPERDRRYEFSWNIDPTHFFRSITLRGVTYKGSWAELMTITESLSSERPPVYLIVTEVLTGQSLPDDVFSSHYVYSTDEPSWKSIYGTGFYGEFSQIVQDLGKLGANAIDFKDLPKKINVARTIKGFVEHLSQKDFLVPPFELENEVPEPKQASVSTPSRNLVSRLLFKRSK